MFGPAVMVAPSARLAKLPLIGVRAVLLMRVKLVPLGNLPVIWSVTINCAPLLMVTPLATT